MENTEKKEFQDITIVCKECGKDFVHTVRDQEFYDKMGFTNQPKFCFECRKARKARQNNENR